MKREELIAELKSDLEEISNSFNREIDILERLKPDTVYLTKIYGESLVKVMGWRKKDLRVKVLANTSAGAFHLALHKGILNLVCGAFKGAVEVPPSDFPLYVGWPYINPEFESMLKKGARQ